MESTFGFMRSDIHQSFGIGGTEMTLEQLHKLASAPVDEATKTIIVEALVAAMRGETFTEEQIEAELDEVHQESPESA